uniref:Enoyl CoA hydratase domain containing 2 n=1 Tax=Esox lucius TaxID=8010 RepID=A0A3P8XSE2_ESOLU
MAFLCRLARRWSHFHGLSALSPASVGGTSSLNLHRLEEDSLPGGRFSVLGYTLTHCRWIQTEASETVEVDLKRLDGKDTGIVEVLMCRQKARNALGRVFVAQMKALVSSLQSDSAVRVVVFRSLVPGVFCAGADLKERAEMNQSESDLFVHSLRSLMTEIAFSAQMGLIETTRGLLPGAGGSQRLPRAVGFALAKELIFTGKKVDGQRAVEIGLVNRATEQSPDGDAAYKEALILAREILPQAPIAVRMAKEAMNRGMEVCYLVLSL